MTAPAVARTVSPGAERIALWRRDPVQFVRDLFGVEPDAWQMEALRAFADPTKPRISMQACAGPGKSTVLAWCGWNFLTCYAEKGHHPVGAAVSITGDNLRNGLWKELAVWRGRSDFLQRAFEMTTERIFNRSHPKTWYLEARSFAKSADQEAQGRTLSGLHSKFIVYLIDEGGDMPPSVLRSAEQGLGNCTVGKIGMAGNTTSQQGALYLAASTQRHLWYVIQITADPDALNRTPRVSAEWAREQIALYGRENPWVMAYILGQYPPGSINALLSADDVNAALGRGLREEDYQHVQMRLGVDVARFGDDRTVIFPRQGLRAFMPAILRNQRGPVIASKVATMKAQFGSESEFIDDTGGWGGSTIDAALLGGIPLVPINASGIADDPRYFNKRSETAFRAAEWVKRGGCLPLELTEIVREATAGTYYFQDGKLRVTEKAQVKTLLNGNSPDLWDAFCLTFATPDVPRAFAGMPGVMRGRGSVLTEWDPFAEDAA